MLKEVNHGKLSIGITPGRGHTVLPMILPDFRKRFPDYELQIYEEDVETLERMLSDGTIEIAFFTMSEKSRLSQNHFSCELISQEEIVLCTPKNGHYELLSKNESGRKYPRIDLKYLENDCFLTLYKQDYIYFLLHFSMSLAGLRRNCGKWTRMTGWRRWRRQTLTPTISFISPAERKVMCSRSVVDKMDVEMAMENSTRLR